MRRFVTLLAVLFFTVPFGISIAGCGKGATLVFCNGGDSGPVVGQLTSMTLTPNVYGISLNTGQFGQVSSPSGVDCKGTAVTPTNITYGVVERDSTGRTVPTSLVDIVPSGSSAGRLCAGQWNRNTGGGIADFTFCTPSTRSGEAFAVANSGSVSSNYLPIFVHPVVTSVVVGPPSTNCSTDLATNCCAFSTTGATTTPITGSYTGTACLSQNVTGQLAARVFAGSGSSQANITCSRTGTDTAGNPIYAPLVGHVTFTPQDTSIVNIDENGIATAHLPGSTVVNANVSTASSTAGYFSTCPPANIALSVPNTTGNPQSVTVTQNNVQPLTAITTDTNGVTLTGLSLQLLSTTPRTLPSGGTGTVTPTFPGSAGITALCQPTTCNPAPLSELGLFGNGLPVISNEITINTPGTNNTVLYAGSTQSRYITQIDFATNTVGTPVRLPYIPNSMVLSTDGLTLYLGSSTELMVVGASSQTLIGQYTTIQGTVLGVTPDSTTIVVTDPNRQTISLVSSSGTVTATYGGVGTHVDFSPDSSTIYITAGTNLIVHSTYTGWTSVPLATAATDISIAKPSVGAFLAGATTAAHGYCPVTTVSGPSATTSNQFYPDAALAGPQTDRLTATNDGLHVIGVTTASGPALTDLVLSHGGVPGLPTGACPASGLRFSATPIFRGILPGISATSITGVVAATDSSRAFVTYTGSGSLVPFYVPNGTSAGTTGSVALSGSATSPVAGIFSSDNNTFFVGTAGDNRIHLLTRSTSGFSDTSTVNPQLNDDANNATAANLLQQKPRQIT